jgi:hypothetical protein
MERWPTAATEKSQQASRELPILATVLRSIMAREKRIRLDEDEKALLRDLRRRRFGGDETPYGFVVAELCRFYEAQNGGVKL